MMKTIILALFIALTGIQGYTQNTDKEQVKKIIEKVNTGYKSKTAYDYLIDFKMYKGAKGIKPEKQYSGRVVKSGASLFYEAAGTQMIQANGQYMRISHEQKLIEYNKVKQNISLPFDLKNLLQHFQAATVLDKGTYWLCTLTVGELTALDYNKAEIYINKDYTIAKQVLYYLKKIPFKNKNGKEEYEYPRLEITITKNKPSKTESLFSINKYISLQNGKAAPSSKYSNYKIIDLSKK